MSPCVIATTCGRREGKMNGILKEENEEDAPGASHDGDGGSHAPGNYATTARKKGMNQRENTRRSKRV